MSALLAGDLGHRTSGRQVAVKDTQMTIRLDGVIKGMNDVLACRVRSHVFPVVRQCLAGDRHAVAMEHSPVEQHLHQWLDTANGHQF